MRSTWIPFSRVVACAVWFFLALGLAFFPLFAEISKTEAGTRENLVQPLEERIALLEKALEYRMEGEAKEIRGDAVGALAAYRQSYALYEDPFLEEKIRFLEKVAEQLSGTLPSGRVPPDLEPLRERIAYLERLLAGPGFSEDFVDPLGEDLFEDEDADWRNYPDLAEEKAAIEENFEEFRSALKEKDIPRAVSHIDLGCREEYAALFAHNPEAMPSFAEILEKAEMSFLAAADRADPATSTSLRTSEYAVELDGFTFYVRWIKVEDRWVLFDF